MAYRQHYRLVVSGTLYGAEIWSNSLAMARPVEAGSDDKSEEIIDQVLPAVRTFYGSSHFPVGMVVDRVKFNRIGPDGKYANSSQTTERLLAGTTGASALIQGTSTQRPAPQLSLVLTLASDRERGPGSKGRIYLPAPAVAGADVETVGGRLTVAQTGPTSPLAVACGTYLQSLNDSDGIDVDAPRVVIATPGGRGMPEGDNIPVTRYAIGRVIDTQRRRRNNLSEDLNYSVVA